MKAGKDEFSFEQKTKLQFNKSERGRPDLNKRICKPLLIIGFLFVLLFVIPMLTAFLAVHFPLADLITRGQNHFPGYSNTEKSFFYTADEASAQKDFEDIAYYFENIDWKTEILSIVATAADPEETKRILKKRVSYRHSRSF